MREIKRNEFYNKIISKKIQKKNLNENNIKRRSYNRTEQLNSMKCVQQLATATAPATINSITRSAISALYFLFSFDCMECYPTVIRYLSIQ